MTNKNNITISDDYIITTGDILYEPSESIGCIMFTNLKKHKDQIAQIDATSGEKDTFGQLFQRSVRTALHMIDKNITRDHIITLCTTNHLNSAVPYIATQFIGARVASLDPSLSQEEMIHLISQVRPKMIFTIPESVATIEKILQEIKLDSEIVVFGHSPGHTQFSNFLKPHQKEEDFEPVKISNLKDTAVIHFSSGTTGMPKGICLSHYSFVGQILNARVTKIPDPELINSFKERMSLPITTLGYTSLYWLSGGGILLGSILDGHCRLLCPYFDGEEIWNLIEKYKPSLLLLTPIQTMAMLANRRNVDVRCVLNISVIGSAISKEYYQQLQEIFPETYLFKGYGQTEICGGLTLFKPMDKYHRSLMRNEEKIESVGLPLRGISYKVVDIETRKNLGPNRNGELCVRSKFVMNGYYNADCSESFDEDGWLKTGDVVYYDQDFCFYVVDRVKESFKYQGWFIAPAMIENVLINHPAVKQAVVIGVPHDDGHHAMGLVVVDGSLGVSEEEIEKFVEERVPERQRLRAGVRFMESMPLTVTGKVNRREVKRMVLEGKK